MNDDLIPRCEHGQIVLGCARDDCRIQNEYLAAQEASLQAWQDRIRRDAEQVVREALGLPTSEDGGWGALATTPPRPVLDSA